MSSRQVDESKLDCKINSSLQYCSDGGDDSSHTTDVTLNYCIPVIPARIHQTSSIVFMCVNCRIAIRPIVHRWDCRTLMRLRLIKQLHTKNNSFLCSSTLDSQLTFFITYFLFALHIFAFGFSSRYSHPVLRFIPHVMNLCDMAYSKLLALRST